MEKFDFSKPADQQKFEQLPPDEKEFEINRANDEAIEVKKKAKDLWKRSDFKPRNEPTQKNYADASWIIDRILKPWEKNIDRYETERKSMELLSLTPENNIFLENREEFDVEFPKDVLEDESDKWSKKKIVNGTEKKRIVVETYDISKVNRPRSHGNDPKIYQQYLVNSITGGDYLDPGKLTHVLGGYAGRNRTHINPKDRIDQKVWFGAGGSYWFSPGDTVIIVDPLNERFIQFCDAIQHTKGDHFLGIERGLRDMASEDNQREAVNDFAAAAHHDKEDGIEVRFLQDERCPPSWASICGWIVDLGAMKLYKINEI